MNFSLIRYLVVGAAIVALFISLVGQTAMADGRNGSRHDKEVKHHKSAKHDKRVKHQKKVEHLKNLKCTSGQVAKSNGGRRWSCAPDADTNTDTLADLECMNGDIVVFGAGLDDEQWICESDLPAPDRFVDNGDETVTDNQTGLMWEKKLASTDAACIPLLKADRDVRCVQNKYTWTDDGTDGTAANGSLYTDFLATLNLEVTDDVNAICFANRCDWRVPTLSQLRTIQDCGFGIPCIDTFFFGPTQAFGYWSSTTLGGGALALVAAWLVDFNNDIGSITKSLPFHARAVRGGH